MPAPMHESLTPPLRRWVAEQAVRMGLPGPDDYILLLIRLEKQRLELGPSAEPAPGATLAG
jgi:hypothetical protein